ncbi:MAG: serine/threonine protein kinase [Sandaracinaceae bacterium]|nr:serine/threonine protein kinase [Sandaracinaceae bacterium]
MLERYLGRYELLERLDVGGMAEVFKARQEGVAGFERLVAIKRLLPHVAADSDLVRMFVEEAKLAVQLSHPSIARVFDLGTDDGGYFIAMEFIEGRSLAAIGQQLAAEGHRLPLGAVAYVVEHVADALHYAHGATDTLGRQLGIVHRDVSPQNVLVSFEGAVKVIDFGLAKAAHRVSQTRAGVVKGKLAYLSPEQAHGRRVDARTDVFALGICAWEMLTGARAFKREDDQQTVLAIRAGQIDPPSRLVPVPRDLEAIVMRALAADPNARYQSAGELRDAIAHFAQSARLRFRQRDLVELMHGLFFESYGATDEATTHRLQAPSHDETDTLPQVRLPEHR